MPSVTRSAERLIGLFGMWVEVGATVDGQTVSDLIVPDGSPTSNWPSIGVVLPGAAWETDQDDDSYLAPSAGGGFRKVDRMNVMQDRLKFQTRQMSAIVDRLLMGIPSLTEGTAASPHTVTDRYIRGWLLLQARLVGGNGTGTDDYRYMAFGDLRLAAQPKMENKVVSPELVFIEIPNVLNSVVFPAAA